MDLATIQIKVDTRQVKAANDDIKKLGNTGQASSKKVNAANDDMAKSAKSTTSAFKLLGGAIAALGVGALVSSFARTVTESEKLKGSLKTMTGSTEDAAFAFSELERFASQTPFTLDQSVEGFIKLKALGLDPSERALRSYGNTSAAMGKDMMQMVEAVADASTGEFERLKEFGIKAKKEGDTVSLTFQGLTTTIGNSSAEIQEYLLEIGETQFGSAMEDQMAALPGLLSNLEDSVGALFRKIGDVGGVGLFAGAISAASTVIVGITNNLDILGTGLAAAMAGFVAFTVGTNAAAILGGFGKMRGAVLALNLAIRANPIGFIASAIAIAATAIIMNFDAIKVGAEKAAINIQIGFQKLKIFLLEGIGGALIKLSGMFTHMQNVAVATMTAVAAAVKNPTNAFDTFNETFDTTLESLESGRTSTSRFSTTIQSSKDRVRDLNDQLAGMNTEVISADNNYQEAERSLSDYAIEIDESAVAANDLAAQTEAARVKTLELLGEISNETEALNMSNVEIAIRNNLQTAGVTATSELGEQIVAATTQLHAEKDALDAASEAAKALEEQHDESQKAIEKEAERVADVAEKAYERMKNNISGFFVDTFENGKVNFEKIATSFKNMIIKMLADWAASKIAEVMKGTFSGIGSSISSMFSGIFSSIGSSISTLASKAASVISGGTAAATGSAAAATGAGIAATLGTSAAASAGINAAALASGSGLAAGTAAGFTAGGSGVLGGTTAVTGLSAAGGSAAAGSAAAAGGGAAGGGAGIMAGIKAGGAKALAFMTNPVVLTLAAIAAAAHLLDDSGTYSANAGLITDPTINLGDRAFHVDKFASGAQFRGFNRREDQGTANAVVESFATLDSALTAAALAAGITPNLNSASFVGSSETGRGRGAFLGTASEDGSTKSASLQDQLDSYATQWITMVGEANGVDPATIAQIVGSGTTSGILSRANPSAAGLVNDLSISGDARPQQGPMEIDGYHRDGLDMVPHDGYVAELHAGERVQTANQARSADSMADEMSGLRQTMEEVMIAVARNTGKLYRLNDRWDKNGLPPFRT